MNGCLVSGVWVAGRLTLLVDWILVHRWKMPYFGALPFPQLPEPFVVELISDFLHSFYYLPELTRSFLLQLFWSARRYVIDKAGIARTFAASWLAQH